MPRIHVFNSLLLLIFWIVQGSVEAFPPSYFALNVSQNLIKIYCSQTLKFDIFSHFEIKYFTNIQDWLMTDQLSL